MVTIHKLSNVQERKLLKKLVDAREIGHGSSRLVFIDPRDSNFVVKVAIGSKSFRQNKLEVAMWKEWGHTGKLARIKEYGNFCVVMERCEATYQEEDLDTLVNADALFAVSDYLTNILGYTSDNYQIGCIGDRWVAYDYGFDPETPCSVQVGWATDMHYGDITGYLLKARQLLLQKQPTNKCDKWYRELCED